MINYKFWNKVVQYPETSKKPERFWIVRFAIVLFVLASLTPILACAYVGFMKGYLFDFGWWLRISLKTFEVVLKGLSEFGKEVSKFLMSLVFGYFLFFDNAQFKVKKIKPWQLVAIPAFFIILVAVDKSTQKIVDYWRATIVIYQESNNLSVAEAMNKYILPAHGSEK